MAAVLACDAALLLRVCGCIALTPSFASSLIVNDCSQPYHKLSHYSLVLPASNLCENLQRRVSKAHRDRFENTLQPGSVVQIIGRHSIIIEFLSCYSSSNSVGGTPVSCAVAATPSFSAT